VTRFNSAIVRPPGRTFADGLTSVSLGTPSLALALEQHAAYVAALERCGLTVTTLAPDDALPDSTFVEDTAVIAGSHAMLARPGAASRRGETRAIRDTIARFFPDFEEMLAPGTLDGGDVCEAGECVYIGLSDRTNRAGAEQLAAFVARTGAKATIVDMAGITGILHLKSGMSYVGDGIFVAIDELLPRLDLSGSRVLRVPPGEEYGANCVRVNECVLVAAGYPALEELLRSCGLKPVALEMSEYQKMDGGLSCLSLRF
jgi:dimethylargininase